MQLQPTGSVRAVYQSVRLFLFFFYQTITKLQTFWIPNKFNASIGSTNQVFFKAFTLYIPVGVHGCNMRLGEQKSQLLLRWAVSPCLYLQVFGRNFEWNASACSRHLRAPNYRILS